MASNATETTALLTAPRNERVERLREETFISQSGKHASFKYCAHGRDPVDCCNDENDGQILSLSSRMNDPWTHCHSPDREHSVDRLARKKLIIASILCLFFMVAEAVGGFLANSLAIATDAAHLLTDFASFMISLFSIWLASRPASKKFSFGWYRAEVIGALTSVLLIWVVTGILVYMAIERLISKNYEIEATIMLITAGLGVIVNLIMGLSLAAGGVPHGHSHGPANLERGENIGHGHSHSFSAHSHGQKGKGRDNINVRAAIIHVIGDFLQSVGVFIAALVIFFYPEMGYIDPICTFLFSILVLVTTFNILRDVLNVFMEGIPKGVNFIEVRETLLSIPGVVTVHNLRVWSLSLDKVAMSTHLAVEKGKDPAEVLKAASTSIRSKFEVFELTIQVEEYKDEMDECTQCQNPE